MFVVPLDGQQVFSSGTRVNIKQPSVDYVGRDALKIDGLAHQCPRVLRSSGPVSQEGTASLLLAPGSETCTYVSDQAAAAVALQLSWT